jgi:predicted Zn-dependent protease with MMP-like domain/Flp pilus assembly protein TadD
MRRPERGRGDPAADPAAGLVESAADAFEAGRVEEALERAEAALRASPRHVPALHYRAAALAELDRLEDARAAYEEAIRAGKDDPELMLGAADFLLNRLGGDGDAEREDLERGLELAARGRKLARRRGDAELAGELAWLEGVALNQLGRSGEALAALDAAEEALPGAVEVLIERGFALYELSRLEEAAEVLRRAVAADPEDPWAQHTLGLVLERRGDPEEARRRFARARKLAPDEFPRPVSLSREAFDRVVEDALAALPEGVRRYLSNVPILVEDLPAETDLRASDPPLSPSILGVFRGAPYGQKASMDPWQHFPSSIVLYQTNLERFARDRAELVQEIGVTLVHEVGHFLGLDEEELWERGLD